MRTLIFMNTLETPIMRPGYLPLTPRLREPGARYLNIENDLEAVTCRLTRCGREEGGGMRRGGKGCF